MAIRKELKHSILGKSSKAYLPIATCKSGETVDGSIDVDLSGITGLKGHVYEVWSPTGLNDPYLIISGDHATGMILGYTGSSDTIAYTFDPTLLSAQHGQLFGIEFTCYDATDITIERTSPDIIVEIKDSILDLGITGSSIPANIYQGPQGLTGAQGLTGNIGVTGLPGGPVGFQGITGVDGVRGLTGVTGLTGSIGITGNQGAIGITGAVGTAGTIGITGTIGTTGSVGITGVIGITGQQGAAGLGATGVQGITGLIGVTGSIGVTGIRGETGAQGVTGLIGLTGIIGLTGLSIGITGTININIDGGGSAITTGDKIDFQLPYGLQVNNWSVMAHETGSFRCSLWRDTYANFPPAVAKTMGTTGPWLTNAIKNTGTTSAWAGATGATGDCVRVNVDQVTTCTRVGVAIHYTKT